MALTEEQKAARAEKRRIRAALAAEADEHRLAERRHEWHEKGMYLSREQAAAGEPCRGCGLPVIDNLGGWRPTMQLTDEERMAREADDAAFRERHKDCRSHRWSMEGSRATHCGLCCPPIPMSDAQAERISSLLQSFPPRRDEELDIWARTLTCGHEVTQSVHHTNQSPSSSTQWCPECEVTRGVVSSIKTVEAAARMADIKQKRNAELVKAERELQKAEKAARDAKRKLDELRASS